MLSSSTYGVYAYMVSKGRVMTYKELAKEFGEGQKKMMAALKELRDLNVICTEKIRFGNRIMTVSRFVERTLWSAEDALLLKTYEQNSNLILNAYSAIKLQKELSDEVGLEGNGEMEDYFSLGQIEQDPDDLANAKRRAQKARHEETLAKKKAKAEKNIQALQGKSPVDWNVSNAVYEFKSRLVRMDVKPWEGTVTDFKIAYAKKRNEFGTTGDTEKEMMDIFFATLDNDTSIKDPNMLWRRFIKDYAVLSSQVFDRVDSRENFSEIEADALEEFKRF